MDESPNTYFRHGNCSHTLRDNPSWWRVDLGSDKVPVSEVHIVNRFSPYPSVQNRNKDFKITLGKFISINQIK